jgi:NAD(P)-dependent dehydrogenase (short-subunit alcohol dehydrogenase family)
MSRSGIFDKFDLAGRVAVVTGGAGLLGKEFCRTLAEAGAAVVVVDLNENAAVQVAESLLREGFRARAVQTDVTDPASTRRMATATMDTYGRLDILVNSAALDPKVDPQALANARKEHGDAAPLGSFEDYPLDAWNAALNVNLTGMFLVTQACVAPMLAQGKGGYKSSGGDSSSEGSIINICSTYGLNGPDQRIYRKQDGHPQTFKPVYYSVTKAGVLGFTRYLAAYYMGTRIRVNALTPGGVYNQHDDTFVENYAAKTILGRMANKDEMNGALLFLASEASSYMTGANLVVDGGWTAW